MTFYSQRAENNRRAIKNSARKIAVRVQRLISCLKYSGVEMTLFRDVDEVSMELAQKSTGTRMSVFADIRELCQNTVVRSNVASCLMNGRICPVEQHEVFRYLKTLGFLIHTRQLVVAIGHEQPASVNVNEPAANQGSLSECLAEFDSHAPRPSCTACTASSDAQPRQGWMASPKVQSGKNQRFSPAEIATHIKAAELRENGWTSTCELYGKQSGWRSR